MKYILFIFLFLIFFAQNLISQREILYLKNPSDNLKLIAEKIRDGSNFYDTNSFLNKKQYFIRIAMKKFSIDENNQIPENAFLGTKPFVFFTVPESIYGKNILDIYLDIGYEAEDIIRWQKNQDMVAIVFCYDNTISISKEQNGQLPENWKKYVYIPTWKNSLAIFTKLASDAKVEAHKQGEFAPENLFFKTEIEKNFVVNYPEEAKKRVMSVPYSELKITGGADWVYRAFLEKKLSLFEHFRGNGRTINEIVDPDGTQQESGVLEFLGPNIKISELEEIAIIYLGRLSILESYRKDK